VKSDFNYFTLKKVSTAATATANHSSVVCTIGHLMIAAALFTSEPSQAIELHTFLDKIACILGLKENAKPPEKAARRFTANDLKKIDQIVSQAKTDILSTFDKNAQVFPEYFAGTFPPLSFNGTDVLPTRLLPDDPLMAQIANEIYLQLQNREKIADFIELVMRRLLIEKFKFAQASELERLSENGKSMSTDDIGSQVLQALAHEQGWKEIIYLTGINYTDEHFRKMLSQGKLFYDPFGTTFEHTGSAHLLQFLFLTPIIDEKFGKGSTRKFMMSLGSMRDNRLWAEMFDHGPRYFRDFRFPMAFRMLGLVGQSSYFGVD
jgi:hypothetical protein